jgi:hypothetical protein
MNQTLTPSAAKAHYEAMCALGTASFHPDAWREMGRVLTEAADAAPLGFQTPLRDRAKDCHARAVRAAYSGCVGAGFRSEVAS